MRKFLMGVALTTALLFTGAGGAMAATEHCPAGGVKTNSGSAGNDVVLAEGTSFCVKASNEATGILTADGETSLIEYVEQAGITNKKGEPHDVSYFVVYTAPSETPSPTPSPEPEPEPEPSDEPPVGSPTFDDKEGPNVPGTRFGTIAETGIEATLGLVALALLLMGGGMLWLVRTRT